jgi:hypothetical protein
MKTEMFPLVLLAAFASVSASAGVVPDQCTVSLGGQVLGSFKATVGEEELTMQAYAIPGTKLQAIARVYFTDELIGLNVGNGAVLDISTTIRLDVDKQVPADPNFPLLDKANVTRAILDNFGDINMMDVCKKALADPQYAAQVARSEGDMAVLMDSCKSYVELGGKNVISASKAVAGGKLELVCKGE